MPMMSHEFMCMPVQSGPGVDQARMQDRTPFLSHTYRLWCSESEGAERTRPSAVVDSQSRFTSLGGKAFRNESFGLKRRTQ